MRDAGCSETTQLLRAWAGGDRDALEQLTPRVYDELRRIAGHFMQDERPGRTDSDHCPGPRSLPETDRRRRTWTGSTAPTSSRYRRR